MFLTDEHCRALNVKIGDRLVWTLSEEHGVSVKKRTKRYKLRKDEYDSFVIEGD